MYQPTEDLKRLCYDEVKLKVEYEQFENYQYNSIEWELDTYVFE